MRCASCIRSTSNKLLLGAGLAAWMATASAGLFAGAREDAAEDLARARRDRDLYVGEAVAELSAPRADAVQAMAQARSDARAALALAVQSVIRAKVTAKAVVVDGVVKESVESESSAEATVRLRNIGYREYQDQPKPGQVTVLAFITREDYRRMLAGLGFRQFRPEAGVMAGIRFKDFGGLRSLFDASQAAQQAAPDLPQYNNMGKATVGPAPAYLLWMVDAHWKDFYAGFGWHHEAVGLHAFDLAKDQVYRNTLYDLNLFHYELGWDWVFSETRLQPFLPLRLQATYFELSSQSAARSVSYPGWAYGAAAGFGGRWWANEKVALEGAFLWTLPLNQAQLMGASGPLRFSPGVDAPAISAGGLEMRLDLRYSAF